MWFILLLPLLALAQSDLDLSAIQDLDAILPEHDIQRDAYRNIPFERKNREFRPPVRIVEMDEILQSDLAPGHLRQGSIIYRVGDNHPFRINRDMYVKYHRLRDEQGFFYLKGRGKKVEYKAFETSLEPVAKVTDLYEEPQRYSPADPNMIKTEYDRRLRLVPEGALYAGLVQARYIRDLFNDPKARSGNMNQYAFHYFTDWKYLLKVGASVHYERSSYNLSGGGNVFYEALSFGPQFRTQDFDFFETNWRFTTQIRVSPFAHLRGETVNGNVNFKFNSTDLMTTLEHPWENRFGQFVLGAFHQIQWLSLKDQPEIVSVRSSNQTNQGFGLFLAQVFQ